MNAATIMQLALCWDTWPDSVALPSRLLALCCAIGSQVSPRAVVGHPSAGEHASSPAVRVGHVNVIRDFTAIRKAAAAGKCAGEHARALALTPALGSLGLGPTVPLSVISPLPPPLPSPLPLPLLLRRGAWGDLHGAVERRGCGAPAPMGGERCR